MKLKHTSLLVAVTGLVATSAAFAQDSTPVVVYDNTSTSLFQAYFEPNGKEYGDQIWLANAAVTDGVDAGKIARTITKVEFEYFGQDTTAGDTATLNIYDFEPGNPNAGGLLKSITGVSVADGFNTVELNLTGDEAVLVRSSLTWTVSFNLQDSASRAGLSFYSPATVTGTQPADANAYWVKSGAGDTWIQATFPDGTPANFGARFTAVPEPGTIALGLIAGLSVFGMRFMRRRNG